MAAALRPQGDSRGIPRFVSLLSSLLHRTAEANDSAVVQAAQREPTAFHGSSRPPISVSGYFERIFTYANCSPSCYVVALVYLDRFARHQPLVAIDSLSVHRLIITSVMVAAKFLDDVCYNNAFFAMVGGIGTVEMNLLELDFLFGLNFQLNVSPTTFQSYCALLQAEMYLDSSPPPFPSSRRFFSSEADEQQQRRQRLTA